MWPYLLDSYLLIVSPLCVAQGYDEVLPNDSNMMGSYNIVMGNNIVEGIKERYYMTVVHMTSATLHI